MATCLLGLWCLFPVIAQEEEGGYLPELQDTIPWQPLSIALLPAGWDLLEGYPLTHLADGRWHGCVGLSGAPCNWRIGWDTDSGTVVLDPLEADLLVSDHQEVKEFDLDLDGDMELVVTWEDHIGHTGWEHAIHERERGIVIIDVQHGRSIPIHTHAQLEEWGTDYAEAPDTVAYEDREVVSTWSEGWCEKRRVEVEQGRLLIGPVTDCDTDSRLLHPFTLSKVGLVRRR